MTHCIIYHTSIPDLYLENKRELYSIQHQVGIYLREQIIKKYKFEHTNISHSEDLVVCVGAKEAIGIDVEFIKRINVNDFNRELFPHSIWTDITQSQNMSETFFKYWTRLESVLKATRMGFSIPLNELMWILDKNCIQIGFDKWNYSELVINNNFSCSISSKNKFIISKVLINEIYFNNIKIRQNYE